VQVLRIEQESEEVTVFYRPNGLCIEELNKNPVANALAVTFLVSSYEVTIALCSSSTGLLSWRQT
jgi:hypothetical protein